MENEDCAAFLRTLEDGSADLVLTDPPYEVSRSTNFASGAPKGKDTDRFRLSMDFGEWDAGGRSEALGEAVRECFRVLRDGGQMICFYDLWKIGDLKSMMESAGFRQIRFIEWVKTNPVPLNSKVNYPTNAREAAVCGTKKGRPVFHSEYDSGIYRHPICRDAGRFHPTQKPVALMRELIEKHSEPGVMVVDPFMGSATTGAACLGAGRRFAGCELDREYFEKAEERLAGMLAGRNFPRPEL